MEYITNFESEELLTEIFRMATENFYVDFDIKNIVTKARKSDVERTLALKNNKFNIYEEKSIIKYNDYYIKRKERL